MHRIFTRGRIVLAAIALTAFSAPLLTPTPAEAWWYHPGWHGGWHPGWHGGWHRGWVGCCGGPGFVVVAPPPVVVVRPAYVGGPVWIRPHWNGPYWVPGHWR